MTIELGDLTIGKLTHVVVRESARIATHHAPGMAGSLSQVMGRPSVEVSFCGIVFGETPIDDLQPLRDAYLAGEPVGFFTASIGEGYFTEVLIKRLTVSERATEPNQLSFSCEVIEYVEPPEPAVADPFGDINTDLLDEATAFIDDVQNALEQVSALTDLLTGAFDFANPVSRIGELGATFSTLVGDNSSSIDDMGEGF